MKVLYINPLWLEESKEIEGSTEMMSGCKIFESVFMYKNSKDCDNNKKLDYQDSITALNPTNVWV